MRGTDRRTVDRSPCSCKTCPLNLKAEDESLAQIYKEMDSFSNFSGGQEGGGKERIGKCGRHISAWFLPACQLNGRSPPILFSCQASVMLLLMRLLLTICVALWLIFYLICLAKEERDSLLVQHMFLNQGVYFSVQCKARLFVYG